MPLQNSFAGMDGRAENRLAKIMPACKIIQGKCRVNNMWGRMQDEQTEKKCLWPPASIYFFGTPY